MVNFSEEEKGFLKRAITATKKDLDGMGYDPTKREDLIIIVNTYRAKGYMPSLRSDGGKEYDLWNLLRNKLGSPTLTREEILIKQNKEHAEAHLRRITAVHDKKINDLERKLELAQKLKFESQIEMESSIKKELAAIEQKKQNALKRLENATSARKKLKIDKEISEIENDRKEILEPNGKGERKCWVCGDWFIVAGGVFTKHLKQCEKERKKKE